MVEPRRRPAPRTLSATPPPSSRVPQPTLIQSRFPSLVAVLAGGALVPACHAPACGDTRADELSAHGTESLRAVRRGEASAALREIGVALGVTSHAGTARIPSPGEAPMVTTVPRPEVPIAVPPPPGAAPMVDPTPLPEHPIAPSGGIRAIDPTPPPQPPVAPHHTTRPHRPAEPRPAVPGGLAIVAPTPVPERPVESEGGVRAVTHAPADIMQR